MGLQTINDVALGITQAGLSRYLNRRYGKFSSSSFFFLLKTEILYEKCTIGPNVQWTNSHGLTMHVLQLSSH